MAQQDVLAAGDSQPVDEKMSPPPAYTQYSVEPHYTKDYIQPGVEDSPIVALLDLRFQASVIDCPACSARAVTRVELVPGRQAKMEARRMFAKPLGFLLMNRPLKKKELQAAQHFCTNCACLLVQYDLHDQTAEEIHVTHRDMGEHMYRVPPVPGNAHHRAASVWCMAEHERLLQYNRTANRGWAYENGYARWGGAVMWHGPWHSFSSSYGRRQRLNHTSSPPDTYGPSHGYDHTFGYGDRYGQSYGYDHGFSSWDGHGHSHGHGGSPWSGGHSSSHDHSSSSGGGGGDSAGGGSSDSGGGGGSSNF